MSDRDDLRIEPVAPADVERVAGLAAEIWYEHYPSIISRAQIAYMLAQRYDHAILRGELEREDIWWDKATLNGDLCGFSSCLIDPAPATMKLDKLYVRADRRRRGVGRELIGRTILVARRQGCERLVLAVNKRNSMAIAAYDKCGFRVAAAVVKDIGGGFVMDDFIMELQLKTG